MYAPRGVQQSRTNGRGLITRSHARRPADRIASSSSPRQTLGRCLLACSSLPCPPWRERRVIARGRKAQRRSSKSGPGGACGVVPPVPFPNTVVKRSSAYDTARATAWDNRPVPGPPCLTFCFSTDSGPEVRSSWPFLYVVSFCDNHPYTLPSSSRGLGRRPFKAEIRGSNPLGGTTRDP